MGRRPLAAIPGHVFVDGWQTSCLLCWIPTDPRPAKPYRCWRAAPSGRRCTREPGHPDLHATCGTLLDEHPLEVWED